MGEFEAQAVQALQAQNTEIREVEAQASKALQARNAEVARLQSCIEQERANMQRGLVDAVGHGRSRASHLEAEVSQLVANYAASLSKCSRC